MNRATPYLLTALGSLASFLPAQTLSHPAVATTAQPAPASQGANNTLILMAPSPNSCPVGLRANPAVGLTRDAIDTKPGVPSQTLTMELSNLGSRNITHAQFTVHGLSARGQIDPATLADPDDATTSRQVELSFKVAHDSRASASLLAEGFTSIRWIELDSLTYADGTAWHASPQHTCSVIPSRLMLVATH